MKKIMLLCFVMIQASCIINDDVECGDWERSTLKLSSYNFAFENSCRNILNDYASSFYTWGGDLIISNENGELYNQQLFELSSERIGVANSEISLDYPTNSEEFPQLILDFVSPDKLDFVIDSEVYDPFVESVVNYNGTGKIKNENGNISLEFNCEFNYSGISYSVSCNLIYI